MIRTDGKVETILEIGQGIRSYNRSVLMVKLYGSSISLSSHVSEKKQKETEDK